MEKEKDYNTQNRYSTFPRTKNGQTRFKRPLADPDKIDQKIDESTNRLRKKQATSNAVYKEACDPWKRYRKSFQINQAGAAYIAHANNETFEEKVIKQVKTVRGELSKISTSHHQNIVHLFESLFHDEAIYLVYEIMDISLGQIFSSPLGRLQLFEVAAFSREILIGLQHIHESLKISHGSLDSSTILLSVKGDVKIGNIGTSMLDMRDNSESQSDIKAVGQIVLECLEPATFLRRGKSLLSKHWPPDLIDFVESTKFKSASALVKHDFLQRSPGPSCLKPYIRLGREVAAKEVEILEQ